MDAAMRAQMEPQHAKVKEHLEGLERETGGDRADRQRVAQHAAELVKQLDQMSGTPAIASDRRAWRAGETSLIFATPFNLAKQTGAARAAQPLPSLP